jgi:hypothetical protein
LGTLMVAAAEAMLARWAARVRMDEPLDVAAEMSWLTLDLVARALFGANVDREAAAVGAAVTALNREFMERGLTLRGLLATVTGRPTRNIRPAIATLDRVVHDMIAARRRDGGARVGGLTGGSGLQPPRPAGSPRMCRDVCASGVVRTNARGRRNALSDLRCLPTRLPASEPSDAGIRPIA